MTIDELDNQLRMVEMTVEVLRTKVNLLLGQEHRTKAEELPPKSFTDLKGIWKGLNHSFEAIQAVEYRVPEGWL